MADDPLPIPPFSPARMPDTQSFLAIFLSASFVGVLVLLIFHPVDASTPSGGFFFGALGTLGTMAVTVAQWYFGSSKTSASKDDARDATMNKLINKVVQNGDGK